MSATVINARKVNPSDLSNYAAQTPQFRSLRNFSMLKIAMRKSPVATKTPHAATG